MFTLFALALALQAPVTQDTVKKPEANPQHDQNQALSAEVRQTRETLIKAIPSGIQGWITSEAAKFTSSKEPLTAERIRASVTQRFAGQNLGTNETDAIAFLIATDVALKAQTQHAAQKGVGAGVTPREPAPVPTPTPEPQKEKEKEPAMGVEKQVDPMARYSEAEKIASSLQATAAQASTEALKNLKVQG